MFAVPTHRRHRDHLRLMTLLVTLLVGLAGCGTTAVSSATLPAHAPSPTADLACVTRARSVDMTVRASAIPVTFAEAVPLYAYDQSAPLCLQLGPKRSAEGGVTLQDITYPSPVTGMITATLVFPAWQGPYPGVLFVHWLGNAASTNRTEFMDDALALARAGSASLLVDALWSTNTVGKPSYDMAMAIEQVIELRRDLDVLLSQPGVDPIRIAYVGHDFGAMYGCILLAVDHRISYGALMTPTSHLSAWNLLIDPLSGAERDTYIKRMAVFDPAVNLPHVQLKGLYLQYAQQDIYVSQADAQTVYAAAPSPKEMHSYATDHALAIPQASQDRMTWLKQRLQLVT